MTRKSLIILMAGASMVAGSVVGCSSSAATPTSGASTAASPSATFDGVKVTYAGNAQVELDIPDGHRIFIDVWNQEALAAPPTDKDVLLTTHVHGDHYNQLFVDEFPGQKVTFETKNVTLDWVKVQTIPSSHFNDTISQEGADNYIFVIDVAGLRFAHFGDIGQTKLNVDQLAIIGQPDVAFSQLANPYSDMTADNEKGINLMKQVNPKVLVPCHMDLDSGKKMIVPWPGLYTNDPVVFTKAKLPATSTVLLMGSNATTYASSLGLKQANW